MSDRQVLTLPRFGPEQQELALPDPPADQFECPEWFDEWRKDPGNREIINKFIELARQMKSTGRKRYSHHQILGRVRWDFDLADSEAHFKINDHATPWIGRLAVYECPDLEGFFEFRSAKL